MAACPFYSLAVFTQAAQFSKKTAGLIWSEDQLVGKDQNWAPCVNAASLCKRRHESRSSFHEGNYQPLCSLVPDLFVLISQLL